MKKTLLALIALALVPFVQAQQLTCVIGPTTVNAPTVSVPGANLVQAPTNLAGVGWGTLNVTTAQGQGTAPDGTNTFNTLTDNTTNGRHIIFQNGLNPNSAGLYIASAYFKAGTIRYAQLQISDANSGNNFGAIFDTLDGSVTSTKPVGTPTGTSVSIVPTAQAGVWLATVTMNVTSGLLNVYEIISPSNSGTPTYDVNGNPTYAGTGQSVFVWYAYFAQQIPVGASCPQPQQTVGYNLHTFHAGPFSAANVDIGLTKASGYAFYLTGSFGFPDTPPAVITFNSDGSMTLTGANAGGNGNAVYTLAAKATPVTAWHGQSFGGGAYFEATFSITGTSAANGGSGIFAWWADPSEHAAEQSVFSDNWQGQAAGYVHFTETDFFEIGVGGNPIFQYAGTVIDWSGVFSGGIYPGQFQNNSNRIISLPLGTDFTQPHRYGFLWVPATASTQGYFQWYFDGLPTSDRVFYSQYNCVTAPAPPPTGSSPWLYGVLDCQHPELILNPSATGTMRIYSVDVWQSSTASNLVK